MIEAPRRTIGLRIAATALAGGALAIIFLNDTTWGFLGAAAIAAGLALHRAEQEGRFPRFSQTVLLSVLIASIGTGVLALLGGWPAAIGRSLLEGAVHGLIFGIVAALIVYAVVPPSWVRTRRLAAARDVRGAPAD